MSSRGGLRWKVPATLAANKIASNKEFIGFVNSHMNIESNLFHVICNSAKKSPSHRLPQFCTWETIRQSAEESERVKCQSRHPPAHLNPDCTNKPPGVY